MNDSGVPHLNGKSDIANAAALPVWLVSEYVYAPDGQFVGVLRQRHVMEPQPNGSIRVKVTCEPMPEITGHPLAALKGDWVFDLGREGEELLYYGPDITGKGRSWGERTLTTSGQWSRTTFTAAAYSTAAFSIVLDMERQIVGSTFNRTEANISPLMLSPQPSLTVARTIGVARPEQPDFEWPTFTGSTWPGEIAERWRGTWQRYDHRGEWVETVEVERHYTAHGWTESAENDANPIVDQLDLAHKSVRRYGWAVEAVPFHTTEQHHEQLEVLDAERGIVVGLRRVITHNGGASREVSVDVLTLRPVE